MVDLLGNLSERIKGKLGPFILVIGTTDVSLIPGISFAGASPELTMFTPAADAEFLMTGKCKVIDSVPVTPDGIPTPALITRASLSFLKVTRLIANAGSRVNPKIPFINLNGEPGKDIRYGGLRREVGEGILEQGVILGENLKSDIIYIGESVPGGTTTAAAVLSGLGYDGVSLVSSSSPVNPKELKKRVVDQALKSAPKETLERIFWLSDPVLIAVAGIALGFKGVTVLSGGTQMAAVAAILKELDKGKLSNVGIATTRWIINDSSSNLYSLAKEIGINLTYSNVSFAESKFNGLRAYEQGYVKEGVGAGGSMVMSLSSGVSSQELVRRIEEVYSSLINA
ncbi:nicotinate mononucleotide-dependent phosphoribosyltransferase CobT [Metallosphaera tengchongensis]|uniref:nicotinate mononucleotide-dependent phosphoribosyltransferase CobT n=1 Tax=Metallosphaera tengchongensis TaxID=1532350 RepID=UPI001FE70BEC|nr:TIGR00303 family protein [Metallosphaera tengchongensis]